MNKYNTIKVYNYPDHKPTQYKKYIVWDKNGECDFADYNVVDDVWWLRGTYALKEDVVVAWAELPKPYEEGAENDSNND